MTTAELLTLAGVFTKDPSNATYTAAVIYDMFTAAQEAIARLLHHSYLKELKTKVARAAVATPGTFTMNSDFLRPAYCERDSDGKPITFLEIEDKGYIFNDLNGGTDTEPVWILYDDAGTLKGQILLDTYPVTATQWYIKKPTAIGAGVDPSIIGFDNLFLLYFKHLFHLAEGQMELSSLAFQSFKDEINDLNEKLRG
jgi:hypothetical protein